MQEFLENGIFNFCLHNEIIFSSAEKTDFGKYTLYFDNHTTIIKSVLNNRQLIVFGYAVDVRTGEFKEIAEIILKKTTSITEILEYEKYLGGKYLLFYCEDSSYYVIPDATASVPFCYSIDSSKIVCSSVCEYVAKYLNLNADPVLQKIRNSSEISQAMPFELTVYKEVKQLLPNHYYSFSEKKAVRFINSNSLQEAISPESAADITSHYIENITKYYSSLFKLYCPITSGRDSRVVLAFLCNAISAEILQCYTIKHTEHTELEQDLIIPKEISKRNGLRYQQIIDVAPSEMLSIRMDSILGVDKYSKRTLMIANTIFNSYHDGAIINGDIIGQIGKCSLHRDIPKFLATAGYFRCKLHNYSKESKAALHDWLEEIKNSGEKINTFDLFSIENRMGRWAAQENIIYNLLGQRYLNIFNSRSIIYEWTRVDRGLRKKSSIHLALINIVNKEFLGVPFEKDKNLLVSLSKINGIFYYLSVCLKYSVKKAMFWVYIEKK